MAMMERVTGTGHRVISHMATEIGERHYMSINNKHWKCLDKDSFTDYKLKVKLSKAKLNKTERVQKLAMYKAKELALWGKVAVLSLQKLRADTHIARK